MYGTTTQNKPTASVGTSLARFGIQPVIGEDFAPQPGIANKQVAVDQMGTNPIPFTPSTASYNQAPTSSTNFAPSPQKLENFTFAQNITGNPHKNPEFLARWKQVNTAMMAMPPALRMQLQAQMKMQNAGQGNRLNFMINEYNKWLSAGGANMPSVPQSPGQDPTNIPQIPGQDPTNPFPPVPGQTNTGGMPVYT